MMHLATYKHATYPSFINAASTFVYTVKMFSNDVQLGQGIQKWTK